MTVEHIILNFINENNPYLCIKVSSTTNMRRIREAISTRIGSRVNKIYKSNGDLLSDMDTVGDLQLSDQETLNYW